jgi:hypothetical protein
VVAVAIIGYVALVEIATIVGGAARVLPVRVLLPALLVLFSYAGFPVAGIAGRGNRNRSLRANLASWGAAAALITFSGWEIARSLAPPVPEYVSSEINAVVRDMNHRILMGEWGPNAIGGVIFEKPAFPSETWVVKAYSRRPDRFVVLEKENWGRAESLVARKKDMVVIVRFRTLAPPYFDLIRDTGIYSLYLWHASKDPLGIERLRDIYEHPTAESGRSRAL